MVASSSIFVYLMQFVQKTVQTGEVSISVPCPSGPPRKPLHTHLLVTVRPGLCLPPTFRGEEERGALESSASLPSLTSSAVPLSKVQALPMLPEGEGVTGLESQPASTL